MREPISAKAPAGARGLRVSLANVEESRDPLPRGAEDLRIQGQRIGFFVPAVQEDARFLRLPADHARDGERWGVILFDGTPDRRVFLVSHREVARPSEARGSPRYALLRADGDVDPGERTQRLSHVLRGSGTLPTETVVGFAPGKHVALDGVNGALFYDDKDASAVASFQRFVLLCCLCLAYRSTIAASSDRLQKLFREGETTDGARADRRFLDGLIAERRRFALFLARCYRRRPIKADRYEAPRLWEHLHGAFELDEMRSEFEHQLGLAHGILADAELRRAAERDRRLQRRLGCLGVAFSVIGLLLAAAAMLPPIVTWDQAASLLARIGAWVVRAWAAIADLPR